MSDVAVREAIDAVWRIESARLIAALTRLVRDVGVAEDLAQDALIAAFERWPDTGIPDKPGAWLMATAKHRAIDFLRRDSRLGQTHVQLGREQDEAREDVAEAMARELDDPVGDDLLRLIFMTCHPALSSDARVALTLRLVGGLTTPEIARAFLTPEATLAQRIVRAKRTLSEHRVDFELPRPADLAPRLGSVLGVIYLIFNEGYAATTGENWLRPELCDEALRLGRIVVQRMPNQAEAHALVALMEIQASRASARITAQGDPVLLLEQDRGQWDQLMIRRGLAALERAFVLAAQPGPYTLQAAIAACHARAATAGATDWLRIASLYAELARLNPSPVVELNRAVAVSMVSGAAAGLALVETISGDRALRDYAPLPAVRGELLTRLGRHAAAALEFDSAAGLSQNVRQRSQFLSRAALARTQSDGMIE
jgi:RNA polymerase sigma factor (sigma-70 family)